MSEQPPADPTGPPPWQPPPPPPYGQQQPGFSAPAPPPATGKATAALVLGICGVIICPLVLSVPAIILGRSATREIDASQGQLGGRSQAQAGFILGIIGTAIALIAALIVAVVFAFGNTISDSFEETCSTITDPNAFDSTSC